MKINKNLTKYSNPIMAQKMARKYLNKTVKLLPSTRFEKKYMILDPKTNHYVHFGQMGYQDYTKHHNKIRRHNYRNRATHIKGNWKNNKYSPNNLAIHILW